MMHGRRSWAALAALAAAIAGCGSTVSKGDTGSTTGSTATGTTTSGGTGGSSPTTGSTGGAGTTGSTGGGTTTSGGTGGGAGTAGVLAMLDDQPITLATIGDSVYVGLFFDGIVSVPKAGGAVTPIVPSVGGYMPAVEIQNAFVFDKTNLYWSESSGGDTSGPIALAPVGGGQTTVLASSMGFTSGIAVDASNVYWVDQDEGTVDGVPIGGGAATPLATGLETPGGLALHTGTLYLTDAAGDLLSVPVGGGSAKTLFAGPGLPPNVEAADYSPAVIADDANVYFVVCDWEGGGETIYRYPLGGNGAAQVIVNASVSQCATALAVDATDLYYADGANIMAVPIAGGTPRLVVTSPQPVVAGPAIDQENVYWGITPDEVSCGLCPPPAMGQINAVMWAPKSGS